MGPLIQRLLNKGLLRLQKDSEVARFDGIILADTEQNVLFRETVLSALRLLKEIDIRRFHRVRRYIAWVVNCRLPFEGGQYHYPTRTCRLDFEIPADGLDRDYAIGVVARTLVHEATHARLQASGVPYNSRFRTRIERCCYSEESRFIARLSETRPEVAQYLSREFNESRWTPTWRSSRLHSFCALVGRVRQCAIKRNA